MARSRPCSAKQGFPEDRNSPQVKPGEYTFDIAVEINGKDYGKVPCAIRVIELTGRAVRKGGPCWTIAEFFFGKKEVSTGHKSVD